MIDAEYNNYDRPQEEYNGQGFLPPNNDATVLSMRWEVQQLISQLWEAFANRTFKEKNGEIVLVTKNAYAQPLMNDQGAHDIIQLVQSHINVVTSLSYMSEYDAKLRWNKALKSILKAIVLNQKKYGIKGTSELIMIRETLETLTFFQFMRSVLGREMKSSQTTRQEIRQENSHEPSTNGWFSRRKSER